MKKVLVSIAALLMLAGMAAAMASGTGKLKHIEVDESNAARQRGAETVISTCLMCHSLKYVKFMDLADIGMSQEQIEFLLQDQKPEDRMTSLMPAEVRKESYGKIPPDLSLMAIARKQGPQYIHTLLTGYYYREDGETDNHLFPGIKMPDVLAYADMETEEERAEVEAQSRDVVAFLHWAADPNAEERRSLGVYVIIYLVIFTGLLYLLKRKIWSRIH